MMTPVFLYTDSILFLLCAVVGILIIHVCRHVHLRQTWREVMSHRLAMISVVIFFTYFSVAVIDSIHFRKETEIKSVLDVLLSPIGTQHESTYSAPFSTHAYSKQSWLLPDGRYVNDYPKLVYAGVHLTGTKGQDILKRIGKGTLYALIPWGIILAGLVMIFSRSHHISIRDSFKKILKAQTFIPWRVFLVTVGCMLLLICISHSLEGNYHIFGTDKIGRDIFYLVVKSIRTDLLIAIITISVTLPFAIVFGMLAGYFRGIIDDVVQYVYTTLSSVPDVLLIAAAILSIQIYIANHPAYLQTMESRTDLRLLALCVILGVTSWTNLCRLLRAETLKLREMDYVQAAKVLGTSHIAILSRHIFPNLMHIILIIASLDFSALILAEAVLSYLGIGVDPSTMSWGNMINASRMELARDPLVWWPFVSAFIFMFTLVIALNLIADAVRDAFDPRLGKH